jgi:hypothetical protein
MMFRFTPQQFIVFSFQFVVAAFQLSTINYKLQTLATEGSA